MNTPSERKINYSTIHDGDSLAHQILEIHDGDEEAAYAFVKQLVDELSLTRKRNKLKIAWKAFYFIEALLDLNKTEFDNDYIEEETTEDWHCWE
jgi:hypothetical protein